MKRVFISYSHKDKRWLSRLLVHLQPLDRDGRIDLWADRRIKPGENWIEEIESALLEARVAVLLVSLFSSFVVRQKRMTSYRKCLGLSFSASPNFVHRGVSDQG
jgi:hypothetical protein